MRSPSAGFSRRDFVSNAPSRGSALVIVLFFVVLLSIVTIAFLSRSLTAVKVSSESAGETKSKILAASASDTIIGDFKQEIIAGSGANSGTVNYPIYLPNSNFTAIPFTNGIPSANAVPNLISRSVSPANTSAAAPFLAYPSTLYTSTLTPPNRAASDASANGAYASSKVNSTTPSLNGRYVSAAQWNEHYLIPRNSPGSGTDPTPVSTFVPPDWVVVTRGGINSVTWKSGSGGLNDPTLTNTNCAVGRYAYAVYNEGGLLDMNAAGYPGTDSGSGSTGLTTSQSSYKLSESLADLTQLTVGTASLTQAQVNNLVGWRNYASVEPPSLGGTFGSFTFTQANSSNWLTNFVTGNTNGYMQIVAPGSGVTTPPTDQVFLSRQQLISVAQSLSINSDFLQFLGTFSRALEQPSTVPDPNRPEIVQTGGAPPLYSNAAAYMGNNDGEGGDATINPSFLSIRVGTSFTRLNGTAAIVGEPLVKTKFALKYLTWLSYQGPSALRSGVTSPSSTPGNADYDLYQLENSYGISSAFLQQGTAVNVLAYFGLARNAANTGWVYNHGQNSIMTLAQVAALTGGNAREPDFAELLKAAISAGSLAKAGPNLHNNQYNYQYAIDASLDTAVLQVMANLIDQQSPDSFPTSISLGLSGNTVYGVKDLPYFYRYHLMGIVDRVPAPFFSKASTVTFPSIPTGITTIGALSGPSSAVNYQTGTTQAASWICTTSFTSGTPAVTYNGPATLNSMKQTTLSDPGEVTLMYIPDLWNPHDANTLASSAGLRPTKFRIYAVTDDPVAGTPQWAIGTETQFGGSNSGTTTPAVSSFRGFFPETDVSGSYYNNRIAVTQTFTQATTSMTFTDNSGKLFREPTLLWNNNPTGLSVAAISGATMAGGITDANTSVTYFGFIVGKAPISTQVTYTSTPTAQPSDGTYVIQGTSLANLTLPVANSYPQISFFLQYFSPVGTGTWVTYDVKYPDLHGLNGPSVIADYTDDYSTTYMNPLADGQFSDTASGFDPRSARWGVGTESSLGEVSTGTFGSSMGNTAYLLEPNANSNFNNNTVLATTKFAVLETNRPRADKGDHTNYSNPGMTKDPGMNANVRLYSGVGFSASNGNATDPLEYDGLATQNNSVLTYNSKGSPQSPGSHFYFEDADGVDRLSMGAYADTTMIDDGAPANTSLAVTSTKRIGLPEATADTFDNNATATPTSQSQSRPMVLNRPFRSVAEMGYAFTGVPWRNIDFFTPESGDSALLDTFCVNPPPANALVAGKVDLNTRNAEVLQAIISGAYLDEAANSSSTPPAYALPPLTSSEAANVANKLVSITTDTTHAWRGPLPNVAALVGRYVSNPGATSGTDFYTYTPPAGTTSVSGTALTSVTYAGLSAALDGTVYANASTPLIQRFRESAIRPLAASGQVRVWNLLVDVVAQSGHYPKTATGLDQFVVDGQTHLWVHVAIDRLTGQVLDKQVEAVTP